MAVLLGDVVFNLELVEQFTHLSELQMHNKVDDAARVNLTENSSECLHFQVLVWLTFLNFSKALKILAFDTCFSFFKFKPELLTLSIAMAGPLADYLYLLGNIVNRTGVAVLE